MNTLEHTFEAPTYEKRRIALSSQDPLSFIPHGDRLLVEVLELDETLDSGIILVRPDDQSKEHEVGWCPAVVWNVGSGHRLDTPDQAVAIQTTEKDLTPQNHLVALDPDTGSGVVMAPSKVPMPFVREQVVMVAKYAGSDIKMRGRDFKVITQAHVLGTFPKMRIPVGENERA
jgi:co-chaperonin GroES (HSP10)